MAADFNRIHALAYARRKVLDTFGSSLVHFWPLSDEDELFHDLCRNMPLIGTNMERADGVLDFGYATGKNNGHAADTNSVGDIYGPDASYRETDTAIPLPLGEWTQVRYKSKYGSPQTVYIAPQNTPKARLAADAVRTVTTTVSGAAPPYTHTATFSAVESRPTPEDASPFTGTPPPPVYWAYIPAGVARTTATSALSCKSWKNDEWQDDALYAVADITGADLVYEGNSSTYSSRLGSSHTAQSPVGSTRRIVMVEILAESLSASVGVGPANTNPNSPTIDAWANYGYRQDSWFPNTYLLTCHFYPAYAPADTNKWLYFIYTGNMKIISGGGLTPASYWDDSLGAWNSLSGYGLSVRKTMYGSGTRTLGNLNAALVQYFGSKVAVSVPAGRFRMIQFKSNLSGSQEIYIAIPSLDPKWAKDKGIAALTTQVSGASAPYTHTADLPRYLDFPVRGEYWLYLPEQTWMADDISPEITAKSWEPGSPFWVYEWKNTPRVPLVLFVAPWLPSFPDADNITIQAWVNVLPGCQGGTVFCLGNANEPIASLELQSDLKPKAFVKNTGGNTYTLVGPEFVHPGYNCLTLVYSRGSVMKLYVNGVPVASTVPSNFPVGTGNGPARRVVGASPTANWQHTNFLKRAVIDDVFVARTAATDADILGIYKEYLTAVPLMTTKP